MPPESRIWSSCRSVRLRGVAQSAWTLEWVATSGAVERRATSSKPAWFMCERSIMMPRVVAEPDEVLARLGQPGTDVGAPGKLERHAVAEDRRPAPHRADRAQAHIVEEVERIEVGPDRLGALHVHHAGDLAAAEGRADRRCAAADREVVRARRAPSSAASPPSRARWVARPRASSAPAAAPRTAPPSSAPCSRCPAAATARRWQRGRPRTPPASCGRDRGVRCRSTPSQSSSRWSGASWRRSRKSLWPSKNGMGSVTDGPESLSARALCPWAAMLAVFQHSLRPINPVRRSQGRQDAR